MRRSSVLSFPLQKGSLLRPAGKNGVAPVGQIELVKPGNTKGGSITVPLTSCLTGLESAVRQLTIFVVICKTDKTNQSNRRSTVQ